MLQEFYEQDWIRIDIIKAPRCVGVIDDAKKNTCECLKKFLQLYEAYMQKDDAEEARAKILANKSKNVTLGHPIGNQNWKIAIKYCGSWKIELLMTRSDGELFDENYLQTNTKTICEQVIKIIWDTDIYHIKNSSLMESVSFTPEGAVLTLDRWLPPSEAKRFTQ